jgi:hypothetical protein
LFKLLRPYFSDGAPEELGLAVPQRLILAELYRLAYDSFLGGAFHDTALRKWLAALKEAGEMLGVDEPPNLALEDVDYRVLQVLESFYPVTRTQTQLEADENVGRSRKPIAASLRRLERQGLVCQPCGPRGGWLITEKGRRLMSGS